MRHRLRSTLAVGFDAVVPIDPAVYEITDDARGRAFAFDIEAERENVADVVRESFDRLGVVEEVTVEPGYLRVKVTPEEEGPDPSTVLATLRSVPEAYNDKHATTPELDGLAVVHDHYIGTYRPPNAPTCEESLGDMELKNAPESDGPVFEHTRTDAGEVALQENRRFAYRVTIPFDERIYNPTQTMGGHTRQPVTWDTDAVTDALAVAVDDIPAWPGRPENLPHVAVYPTHAEVVFYTAAYSNPAKVAEVIRDGILKYNWYRNPDDRVNAHKTVTHPQLVFQNRGYVTAVDHGSDAEQWIVDNSLDTVEPIPATDDVDPEADDTGSGWLPFGRS